MIPGAGVLAAGMYPDRGLGAGLGLYDPYLGMHVGAPSTAALGGAYGAMSPMWPSTAAAASMMLGGGGAGGMMAAGLAGTMGGAGFPSSSGATVGPDANLAATIAQQQLLIMQVCEYLILTSACCWQS